MARSLKKGPYVHYALEKKVLQNKETGKKNIIKTVESTPCGTDTHLK